MTKRQLAELVSVTPRAVTAWEAGDITPGELTLGRIAESLGFPTGFFKAPDLEVISEEATSFRALSKMTAGQAHAARAAGQLALALNDWLVDRFRLPDPTVPNLGPGILPETAAEIIRSEWGLGEKPISNVVHLLEAHGTRVFSLAEDYREVDAFSFWRKETPFVFLNMQKSAEHSRMDAAHELGHLMLHRHHEIVVGNKQAEREAQEFASALLMPRSAILAEIPSHATLDQLIPYKRRWRVSLAALVYRMHRVGRISKWQYHTYFVELSQRGYRTNEPKGIPRETSQVLAKTFGTLRREGISKREIAAALYLMPEDLDALVFGLAILPVG